jgi:hypothetical protein
MAVIYLRLQVRQRAEEVELSSLNPENFGALLSELFYDGGVTQVCTGTFTNSGIDLRYEKIFADSFDSLSLRHNVILRRYRTVPEPGA